MEYADVLGKKCAAYNCRLTEYNLINGYRVFSGVQFFSLFVNERARVKWSRVIERASETNKYRASLKTILCEKHFSEAQLANQTRDSCHEKSRHKPTTKLVEHGRSSRKVVKPSNNITWKYVTIEQKSKIPSLREIVEKHVAKRKKSVGGGDSRRQKTRNEIQNTAGISDELWNDEICPTSLDKKHVSHQQHLSKSKSLPTIELTVHDTDSDLSFIMTQTDTKKILSSKRSKERSDRIEDLDKINSAVERSEYVSEDDKNVKNVRNIQGSRNVENVDNVNLTRRKIVKQNQYEIDNHYKQNVLKARRKVNMENEEEAAAKLLEMERENLPGNSGAKNYNIVNNMNAGARCNESLITSTAGHCDMIKVKKIIHGKNIEELKDNQVNNNMLLHEQNENEKVANKKLINEVLQHNQNINELTLSIPAQVSLTEDTTAPKLSSPTKVKPCSSNMDRRFESRSFSYPHGDRIRSRQKSCESEISFMAAKQRSMDETVTSPSRNRRFSYTHCSSPTSSNRKMSNNAYPRLTIQEEQDSADEEVFRHDMTGVTLRKCYNYVENDEHRADDQYLRLKSGLERSGLERSPSTRDNEELHRHIFTSELNLVNHIKASDRPCHYYTGFSTLKHLYNVYEDIRCQHWENLNFYHEQLYNKSSGERKLSPFDGYILTLVRLKRHFSIIHLAFLFEVSETTVSVVLRTWIDFLYKYDSSMWPSTTQIYKTCDSVEERVALQQEVRESLATETKRKVLKDSINGQLLLKEGNGNGEKTHGVGIATNYNERNEILQDLNCGPEINQITKINHELGTKQGADINGNGLKNHVHNGPGETKRTLVVNQTGEIETSLELNREPEIRQITKMNHELETKQNARGTKGAVLDENGVKKHGDNGDIITKIDHELKRTTSKEDERREINDRITDTKAGPEPVITGRNYGLKTNYKPEIKLGGVEEQSPVLNYGRKMSSGCKTHVTTPSSPVLCNGNNRYKDAGYKFDVTGLNHGSTGSKQGLEVRRRVVVNDLVPELRIEREADVNQNEKTDHISESTDDSNNQNTEIKQTIENKQETSRLNNGRGGGVNPDWGKEKVSEINRKLEMNMEEVNEQIPYVLDMPYVPDAPYVSEVLREETEEVTIKTETITIVNENIETMETKHEVIKVSTEGINFEVDQT